jgi:hypothetical protein
MPFQLAVQGRWRLTVVEKEAGFDQRFVVAGAAVGDGIYAGVVGTTVEVVGQDDQAWVLTIQHNDGTGFADSELRETPRVTNGSAITFRVESEDLPGQPNPDFNDLVLQADKVGMVDVPFRPYAVRPDILQMMPDGIFESALGTYYMGVRVRNIWTQPLPAGSLLGISALGRAMLAAGGVQVIDSWTTEEQELLGQQLVGTRILLGSLEPWELRTVFFKVDCSGARPRKHAVEFELVEPAMPDPTSPNRRASQTIFVSRTTFNPTTKEYVAECDQGRLAVKLREVAAEFTSLRDAVACARKHRAEHGDPIDERARQLLKDLLDGKRVDVCELKRLLDCLCAGDGGDGRDGGGFPCGDILLIPTRLDYRVEFQPPFAGQLGPLPYDDPWWKILLIIIAIVLTIAAGASAVSDLAFGSDDVVIGTLFDSKLEPEADGTFLVDAALCELNGNRDLPSVTPPLQLLDAQGGETFTAPVDSLDGAITLSGGTLSNVEIANLIAAFMANPGDPAAIAGVRVFKSGARSGTTHALMTAIAPLNRRDHDGVLRAFSNQVQLVPVPAPPPGSPPDPEAGQAVSQGGDSGSLWVHRDTRRIVALNHAGAADDSGADGFGTRIEDVIAKMNIRFA